MSLASIEARASALMSLHKEELTRALAHFEHLAGFLFDEVEEKIKALVGSVIRSDADEPKAAEHIVPLPADPVPEPVVVAQEPAPDEQQQPEASTGELQAEEPAEEPHPDESALAEASHEEPATAAAVEEQPAEGDAQ